MADTVLESALAITIAREAAVEVAGESGAVGELLGSGEAGPLLVTHLFGARIPGYRGWVWAVTVSRAPEDDAASVCEANLIPADDALLAPPWVPWAERVRPGDLEPSMILPFIEEDPRLVPGYEETGDEDADAVALWELGLGRVRVLGTEGRWQTADRWYRGAHGPQVSSALVSTAPCASCGFFVHLSGSWRSTFGVCANEWSPSDGMVVSLDHGCGAHSETDIERQVGQWEHGEPVIDTMASVPMDFDAPDEVEAFDEAAVPEVLDDPDTADTPDASEAEAVTLEIATNEPALTPEADAEEATTPE